MNPQELTSEQKQFLAALDEALAAFMKLHYVDLDTAGADDAYPFDERPLLDVMGDLKNWRAALVRDFEGARGPR